VLSKMPRGFHPGWTRNEGIAGSVGDGEVMSEVMSEQRLTGSFIHDLNALLSRYRLTLNAGEAEVEGELIVDEVREGDPVPQMELDYRPGCGGFFCLKEVEP